MGLAWFFRLCGFFVLFCFWFHFVLFLALGVPRNFFEVRYAVLGKRNLGK